MGGDSGDDSEGDSEQTTPTEKAAFGMPWAELPAATKDGSFTENYKQCVKIITDAERDKNGYLPRNYSFCYDTERYLARWVAYPMHSYYTSGKNNSETFYNDPEFTEAQQITKTYEDGTVNNRGHQIAKAQRKVTAMARQQTNYNTNMTPQNGTLNGGKWADLEEKEREREKWMCDDTLYMVSGCHFDNYNTKIPNNDGKSCPVPTHYFKVMLRTKSGNSGKKVANCSADELICAGYWVTNTSNAVPVLKSVAEIEKLTGFTFFVNVPNAPKNSYTASDWQ